MIMIKGVIWGLQDGWNEVGKMHELFSVREMGAPLTSVNGACVKEQEKGN
jgi:hypothetical protein